ncbi:MAG: CvpA family protein [Aquabacterium sp.]|nr:CvpA family protein [Aquabacterium sp.]
MPVLGWVDWTLLAVLALSVVVGLWRGLIFELMSLVGWVVAYVAAQLYSPLVAAQLPSGLLGLPGTALNLGAGFALTFIGVLVVWTLLARLVRLLVHATPLTLIDRTLGAAFGLVRGGVLLLALATVVAFTPAARSQPWQDSLGAAWLRVALQGIKPVLPADVAKHLPV